MLGQKTLTFIPGMLSHRLLTHTWDSPSTSDLWHEVFAMKKLTYSESHVFPLISNMCKGSSLLLILYTISLSFMSTRHEDRFLGQYILLPGVTALLTAVTTANWRCAFKQICPWTWGPECQKVPWGNMRLSCWAANWVQANRMYKLSSRQTQCVIHQSLLIFILRLRSALVI